jgi:hypothetical protein
MFATADPRLERYMIVPPLSRATRAGLMLVAVLLAACVDRSPEGFTGPTSTPSLAMSAAQGVDRAIAAQERHTAALMRIPGVVGTGVGALPNGQAVVQIFLERAGVPGLPAVLDDVPVVTRVTGMFVAFSDPTKRQRPAPLGYSIGHPAITAGTLGARVVNASQQVFVLSNNHVLANSNDASIGDAALQPGPFDGGVAADQIGTLFAFKPINFSGGSNTIDSDRRRLWPAGGADLG